MSITATVLHDTIKLPEGVHLEDSTEVVILPKRRPEERFAERFKDLIGSIDSGMGDLAQNHDHYLYGLPKKA